MNYYEAIEAIIQSGRTEEAIEYLLRIMNHDYEETKAQNRIYKAQNNAAIKLIDGGGSMDGIRNLLESEPKGML